MPFNIKKGATLHRPRKLSTNAILIRARTLLHMQCQRGFRHNETTYECIWHYWQRMELPFTIHLTRSALPRSHIREGVKTEPIITQGNQANWHTDQWPPWLMGLLSRWTAPQRDPRSAAPRLQRQREECSSADSQGHLPASTMMQCIKSKPEKIARRDLSTLWGAPGIMKTHMVSGFYNSLYSICVELFSAI